MPGLPAGGAASPGRAPAAGALSTIYAARLAASTLLLARAQGDTTIWLPDAAGFRADMTFGIGIESHDIVAMHNAVQVEIAAPGLLADYAADSGCFATPMFGVDDALALPGSGPYAELDVRLMFDLARANADPANNGRSSGAYHTDPASSWYEALNARNFWWGGGNLEPDLSSYTVGVIHLNAAATDLWVVDYEPAGNRLLIMPADPDTPDTFVPRITALRIVGRA